MPTIISSPKTLQIDGVSETADELPLQEGSTAASMAWLDKVSKITKLVLSEPGYLHRKEHNNRQSGCYVPVAGRRLKPSIVAAPGIRPL